MIIKVHSRRVNKNANIPSWIRNCNETNSALIVMTPLTLLCTYEYYQLQKNKNKALIEDQPLETIPTIIYLKNKKQSRQKKKC